MLAQRVGAEMPICQCAYEVLYENRPVRDVVGALMARRKRRETDESWI